MENKTNGLEAKINQAQAQFLVGLHFPSTRPRYLHLYLPPHSFHFYQP